MEKYCNANIPRDQCTYIYFGIFTSLSMICTTILLDQDLYQKNITFINIMQIIVLALSTLQITNMLWPQDFRKKYLAITWYISIFICSAVASSFLMLINHFSPFSLMIFSVNLLVISYLLKWQETIVILVGGIVMANVICYYYFDTSVFYLQLYDSKFSVIYSLLMVTGSLIFFLKPQQDYQALTEEKVGHLTGRIGIQEKQLYAAEALKSEFIRNVTHEYHTPMTGVISTAEILWKRYEKLTDKQRKQAAKDIYLSSIRLESFDSNINSLSRLSQAGYKLDLEIVDLSILVYDRLALCKKLYEENEEDRDFIVEIENNITIEGDKNYLVQLLDNLIINAMSYCRVGRITIGLKQNIDNICFIITDEGIGIPMGELFNIFEPFACSSKTRTPAGGRGVGLAVCKRIAKVHGGKIWAESDGIKGAIFNVIFPVNKNISI